MFSIHELVYFLATNKLLKHTRNFYRYGQLATIKAVLIEDSTVTYTIAIDGVNINGVHGYMLVSATKNMLNDIGNFAVIHHRAATKIQVLKNPD